MKTDSNLVYNSKTIDAIKTLVYNRSLVENTRKPFVHSNKSSKGKGSVNDVNKILTPPIGLNNLGATCYLNVLIQCLYQNIMIRDSIMNININNTIENQTNMDKIVLSLQKTFAHMCYYKSNTFSLKEFTG